MTGQGILALALAVPFVVLPVAFVWWLNIGGVMVAVKKAAARGVPGGERSRV